MLSKELLEILACPKCKGDLLYEKQKKRLTCRKCRLRYGILKGDIPNMLIDEAEKF
ncbi:Trm112 family protein [archaeon]|nr:Trm112 family protein [archaeon]